MSRAIDLDLVPAQHAEHLSVQAYTYAYTPDIPFAAMRETVHLDADSAAVRVSLRLSPAEARLLAQHLLQVADVAAEHQARREQLDDISEQLRDPDFDASCVHFVHPDVVYCAAGQISETAAQHPDKLVIALHDDDALSAAHEAPHTRAGQRQAGQFEQHAKATGSAA